MPPIRCLLTVPHIQIKRTYHLEEGFVVALKHAIATCPVLGSQVQLSCSKFQVMDPLFNELVDLATEDSIPDMSKIVLMAQQESSGNEAPSCSSSQGTLQAVVETGEQDTPSMVIEPVERPLGSGDNDGINFKLPSLGALHEKVISSPLLTPSTFRQIIDILHNEMAKHTLYPTRCFYSKVTTLLLDKYPQLKDVIGSGHDSWKVALRNKYKNLRRKLDDHEDVLASRQKFGAQKKTGGTTELQRKKAGKMSVSITDLTAEDDDSIAKHEDRLVVETKKLLPDEQLVEKLMALTAGKRLPDVATKTIRDVKKNYPYMMDFQRFCNDFTRLTDIKPVGKVSTAIDKLTQLAVMKKIRCSENTRQMLERARQMDPKRMRTRHIMALVALKIVCENVKERSACSILFVQETDDMPATPCVSYNGAVLEDAEFFWLMVDQTKCFQVTNAEEGLVAIMCANWLFNVQYACKAFNTLVVLERFFFELEKTTPRSVVAKFLNIVVKST
ncbi:hypothetical protein MRX96_000243 [Rhipicephalus microplus]